MTVREARTIIARPLVFGNGTQIKAIRFLEELEEARAALKRCLEIHPRCDRCDGKRLVECDDCEGTGRCPGCDGVGETRCEDCEDTPKCTCLREYSEEVVREVAP